MSSYLLKLQFIILNRLDIKISHLILSSPLDLALSRPLLFPGGCVEGTSIGLVGKIAAAIFNLFNKS